MSPLFWWDGLLAFTLSITSFIHSHKFGLLNRESISSESSAYCQLRAGRMTLSDVGLRKGVRWKGAVRGGGDDGGRRSLTMVREFIYESAENLR